MKEPHPFIEKYPLTKPVKYLVIGTIPPASKNLPERKGKTSREFLIDFYYGNVKSFWRILNTLYPETMFDSIDDILNWKDDYCIGFTDTVKRCTRKDPWSFKDSDLEIEIDDYHHELKTYIINNKDFLHRIIVTSSEGLNNTLSNLKVIMDSQYDEIEDKTSSIPSPSDFSNISFFNKNEDTLGLKVELYDFLILRNSRKEIEYVKTQWMKKKLSAKGEKINRVPKNMVNDYKSWIYKQVFPSHKCLPNEHDFSK
jgi:hypothetical protein